MRRVAIACDAGKGGLEKIGDNNYTGEQLQEWQPGGDAPKWEFTCIIGGVILLEGTFRWSEPQSWPWFIYAWAGLFVLGYVPNIWRYWKKQQASSWPQTSATITHTHIDVKSGFFNAQSRSGSYQGELHYVYFVGGNEYAGKYERSFESDEEAAEFVRGLEKQVVIIHYNEKNPRETRLADADVQAILVNRPAEVLPEIPTMRTDEEASPLIRTLVWIPIFLAGLGLMASVWVHVNALVGLVVLPESAMSLLHVGIFVVFFPAVFAAQKICKGTNRKDFWKVVLRFAPPWMRYVEYGLFAYAMVNFFGAIGTMDTGKKIPASVVTAHEWRLFSGHWMIFYFTSLAILYSVAQSGNAEGYCRRGHRFARGYEKCPQCKEPNLRG